MRLFELFDETLDINSTEIYELSVQAGFDSLSFSVLDTLRNKFIMLREYEPEGDTRFDIEELGDLIAKDDFLTKKFRKVNLITPTSGFTLVPEPLYEASARERYFSFNQVKDERQIIMTNELQDPDAVLIFSSDSLLSNLLQQLFPKECILHQLKPLFHYISLSRKTTGSFYIHVHIESEFVNIIIFDQNTLKFCNSFQYKTSDDLRYFVLYVLKRLKIRRDETIMFSGRMSNKKELISSFTDYLSAMKLAVPTGNFTFSYVFNDSDLFRYLTLFSATMCE